MKKYETGITMTGIYGWIRHPMQSGMLGMCTFGNNIFTLEKISMIIFFIILILIGVKM